MKKSIGLIMVILLSLISFSEEGIKIGKIKIRGNNFTDVKVVNGFMPELYDKTKLWETGELNEKLKRIKERMNASCWFGKIAISQVKTKSNDKEINIIIEIEEGYLERYGGGYLFMAIGRDNFDGKGKNIISTLGTNIQSIKYEDKRLLDNGYLYLKIENHDEKVELSKNNTENNWKVGIDSEAGIRYNHDWYLGAGVSISNNFSSDYREFRFGQREIYMKLKYSDRNSGGNNGNIMELKFSDINLNENSMDNHLNRTLIEYEKIFSLHKSLVMIAGTKAIYQNEGNKNSKLMLDNCGINDVRSRINDENRGNIIWNGKIELRNKLFETLFMNICRLNIEPILFYDIGKNGLGFNDFRERGFIQAAGAGVRIIFDVPVYVAIRCEYSKDSFGNDAIFINVGNLSN